MTRIISYNVNGIRSALGKGLYPWMEAAAPDVLCLQEIKAMPEQVGTEIFDKGGYHHCWHPAEKKGYSGVAILSKKRPDNVIIGTGIPEIDKEGRVIRADFGDLSVMSVYVPSGSSGELRQSYKMEWLTEFSRFMENLLKEKPSLVVCGDLNICHKPIDIHNPVSNAKSSGFLPEEREWMENFLVQRKLTDGFRLSNQDPHNYSWWSYRANARDKNLGWRIDYTLLSEALKPRVQRSAILKEARHSDHCPVMIELEDPA